MILLIVRRAKGDMMHTTSTLPRNRKVRLLDDMQLGSGATLPHRKYMDRNC